ncbi:MAG: hypothetical protein COB84_08960 [Rhodobacteraceae bacterium]|nr:MAG: hypothetical protein COB84_08960 [Paracoccaceae bacterium]
MKYFISIVAFIFGFSTAVWGEAIHYDLVKDGSKVGFNYTFSNNKVSGKFQDYSADLALDFENIKNTRINVTLNTRTAKAGFLFATQAMLSPQVLDAKAHPNIIFRSKSVHSDGNTIVIDGMITVRGVTKPLQLTAQVSRKAGTDAKERDNLRIKITGALNRHDFGASGFSGEVGDMLGITIDAQIRRK